MKAKFLTCFVFALMLSFLSLGISPTTFATPTTAGHITEYLIQTTLTKPYSITQGRDGNLWFTGYASNTIGRITPGGTITEYPVPTASSYPFGITTGPVGNLWFVETFGNKIGRITPG